MAVLIRESEVVNFHITIKPTCVGRILALHLLKSRGVPYSATLFYVYFMSSSWMCSLKGRFYGHEGFPKSGDLLIDLI